MISAFPISFISPSANAPILPTTVVAGNGAFTDVDGVGVLASIAGPTQMCYHAGSNSLYIATLSNSIRKVALPGHVVSTVATSLVSNGSITGITVDPTGTTLYYSLNDFDASTFTIRSIPTTGGSSTLLAGSIEGYVEGTGATARFRRPRGLVLDPFGPDLFVCDSGEITGLYGRRVRRVVTPGGATAAWVGSGTAGYVDAMGASASFNVLGAIAADSLGNAYVSDTSPGAKIRKITPGAVVTTYAGGTGFGLVNSANPLAAQFTVINGMSFDSLDNLYVTETNAIRKIANTGEVTTVSAPPQYVTASGIVAVSTTELYFCDSNSRTLRKIDLI